MKILTDEKNFYLIYEESKKFYREFYDSSCIVKRYVDFSSFADYQLDECFDFLHIKDFASENFPFYPNIVAIFYVNLRIKKNPLTLYSLVKGSMISLGETYSAWYFWNWA